MELGYGIATKNTRWYFTAEQLENSPSRSYGLSAVEERTAKQLAAKLIQDMGKRLRVSQLCMCTATVFVHRFYALHPIQLFYGNSIAPAALFFAAKVESQTRRLRNIIKELCFCLRIPLEENYALLREELIFHESILTQTLGFDTHIEHPHVYIIKGCQKLETSKELAETAYFVASQSISLSTVCLQYKPTVLAAFCIYFASKLLAVEVPQPDTGRLWFQEIDPTVTLDLLMHIMDEFLVNADVCINDLSNS